jgi:hypothetical protein
MARGIDITNLHGRVILNSPVIATQWKGIVVVRKIPKAFTSSTPLQLGYRAQVRACVNAWHNTLTQAQREAWDAYASSIYNLAKWGSIENAVINVIPKHKPIMSGLDAMVSRNSYLYSVGDTTIALKPPVPKPSLNPPFITALSYPEPADSATVHWNPPTIIGSYDYVKQRLWGMVVSKAYRQLLGVFPRTTNSFTFTSMKIAGAVVTPFTGIEPGTLRVQMDCVFYDSGYGAEISAESNVKECIL